jgi:hypothetical protein
VNEFSDSFSNIGPVQPQGSSITRLAPNRQSLEGTDGFHSPRITGISPSASDLVHNVADAPMYENNSVAVTHHGFAIRRTSVKIDVIFRDPELPGALAFLRWQFELTSPIEPFASERDSRFHQKFLTTIE